MRAMEIMYILEIKLNANKNYFTKVVLSKIEIRLDKKGNTVIYDIFIVSFTQYPF